MKHFLGKTHQPFIWRMSLTQKLLWMRKNRGALAKIARDLAVNQASVSDVFWCKKHAALIEQAIEQCIAERQSAPAALSLKGTSESRAESGS